MGKESQIVTFYSFKGGVGRTFALANIAIILARWGYKVLCIDWDLEAPGLHNYFEQIGYKSGAPGILDMLLEFNKETDLKWETKIRPISLPKDFNPEGNIDFITAGKVNGGYVKQLHELDWDDLYENKGLGDSFEKIRNEWKTKYDFVLIDSRTGITDTGGICTIQFPDILLFFVSTNKQSLEGAINVVERVIDARNNLPYDKGKMITVPVISRFDGREEFKLGREWIETFEKRLQSFLKEWIHKDVAVSEILNYLRIPYVSYWSFGERFPVIEDDQNDPDSINYSLETLAAIIANGCKDSNLLAKSRDTFVAKVSHEEVVKKSTVDKQKNYNSIITKTKDYMLEDKYRIKLEELITKELRKAIDLTSKNHFPLQIRDLTDDIIIKRLGNYEEILKPLCGIITVLCHWGNEKHRKLIQNIITKIAENNTIDSGLTDLINLRWYPICLLLYNGGVASLASEKYENLFSLFTAVGPDLEYRRKTKNVLVQMMDSICDCDGLFKKIPGHEKKYVPRSEYIYENLQANLENIVFLGQSYEHLFDIYELFQMFAYADLADVLDWGPIGRFAWKHRRGRDTVVTDFIENAKKQGSNWPPIKAGLFKSDINRFNKIADHLMTRLNNLPGWY